MPDFAEMQLEVRICGSTLGMSNETLLYNLMKSLNIFCALRKGEVFRGLFLRPGKPPSSSWVRFFGSIYRCFFRSPGLEAAPFRALNTG